MDKSKVVWSEGMFLRPQHFQQHDRHVENLINGRCQGFQTYSWGFFSLALDTELLKIGKFAVKGCKGVFPDGTPFNLPEDDDLPLPLDVAEDVQNSIVYLGLPVRRPDETEIDSETQPETLARYRVKEYQAKDCISGADGKVPLEIGKLKTRLLLEGEERAGYTCLAVTRVMESRADKNVVIDEQFIPPGFNCFADPTLHGFLRELHGLLNTRGEALAGRVAAAGQGGVGEIADFLVLQLVNRYQPLLEHLSHVVGLHPEDFYRVALQLSGELATFLRPEKRPVELPPFKHDDLQATFAPLMQELRQLLSMVYQPRAVQISLKGPKYDIYAAMRPDASLLKSASFVLAVHADVPSETIRNEFPHQVKIGPVEEIRQYVNSLTPGLSFHPLAVAPRQIPYHSGFTYFELDKQGDVWKKMTASGGFAFHVGGNYPGLTLEFWAIMED